MSADTFETNLHAFSFVRAATAADILSHFRSKENWHWFLALNRLGKTANLPPISFRADASGVAYLVNDLVNFIHLHVAPCRSTEEITKTIESIRWEVADCVFTGDAELDALLAELSSDEPAMSFPNSGTDFGDEDDVILTMDESFLWDFLSVLDGISAEQVACSANLAVMSSLFEAVVNQHGAEQFPQYEDFLVFAQVATQHARKNAQRIHLLAKSIENRAYLDPNQVIPAELMEPNKKGTATEEMLLGESA